jgi:hypothetical protein
VDIHTGEPVQPEPRPALTLDEWLERELAEPDFLLGNLLSTTTRMIVNGPTGLGKTMLGVAVAFAVASYKGFLKWSAVREGRVLYVDGEMSARQLRQRLLDAMRHSNASRDIPLCVLSTEDCPSMPPLNTRPGQSWFEAFVRVNGPFDLIIFDNIQSLTGGEMKEEDSWRLMQPWVRSLTRLSIGQMWFHHTGHDEGKGYGTNTREWQMDVVALMERVEDATADLAFSLKFTKARERRRENREQFEPIVLKLKDGAWECEAGATPDRRERDKPNHRTMLGLLQDAMPGGLTTDEWNEKARALNIGTKRRATLHDIRRDLHDQKLIHEYADRWFITSK